MDRNALWDNLFRKKDAEPLRELLRNIPLFSSLGSYELTRLERIMHERHYKEDEPVFLEGEPGAALYIIKSGTIAIYKNYDKQAIRLAELGPESFFGEMALFSESPRSATAIAKETCTLLALSKPDLDLFAERNPKIGLKILENLGAIISERLRIANDQIEILQSK